MAAKVLVAFAEWLKLGDAASLQSANLAQHPLLAAALDGLASESAFDEAVDATVELVYCTSSGGQPEPSMLPLVSIIVPWVSFPAPTQSPYPVKPCAHAVRTHALALPWAGAQVLPGGTKQAGLAGGHPCVDTACTIGCCVCWVKSKCNIQVMKQLPLFKRLQQEAASGSDENEDIAKGLARVFAEVGEAYVTLIAAGMPFHFSPSLAVPTKGAHCFTPYQVQ